MPMKLSALDGINDGITTTVQSTVHAGASFPAVHDGLTAHLTSAAIDGSFAPLVTAAILLAAGGVHIIRTRPSLTLRTLSI